MKWKLYPHRLLFALGAAACAIGIEGIGAGTGPSALNAVMAALALGGVVLVLAGAWVWAVRRGGVRCPNCGRRWYGGVPIAARTHEDRFRCPNCGTMIPL